MKIIHDSKTNNYDMILTDSENSFVSDNMFSNLKKIIAFCDYLKKKNVICRSLTFCCDDFSDITVFKTRFMDVKNNENIFIISENEKTRALAIVKNGHIDFHAEIKANLSEGGYRI